MTITRSDAVMNVIIVADHAFINGGQAKVAIESALGLAGRGHRVVFFAAVGPADPRLAAADIAVIVLGQTDVALTTSLASFGVQWLWNRPAALRLKRSSPATIRKTASSTSMAGPRPCRPPSDRC